MSRRLAAPAVAPLFALLAAIGCQSPPAARPASGVPVLVAAVVRGPAVVTVELPGELASPGEAALAAEVAGTVVGVPARVGSVVNAHAPLVVLDPRPFRIAVRQGAARVAQAEAQVAVRGAALDRQRASTERVVEVAARQAGALSDLEVQDARLALAEAEAAAQSAAADLELRAAELDGAQLDLARASLRAPVSGTVIRQDAQLGQRVAAGAPLVTLAVGGSLEALLDLGESHTGQIIPGAAVVLRVPARPDLTTTATVSGVVPAAESRSRSQRLRVDLGELHDGWIPGLAVRGTVEVTRLDDALQVPRDAWSQGVVYAVADGKARRVPVELVFDNGDNLVVTGDLAGGEPVVIRGNEALQDGAAVVVIEGPSADAR